MSDDYCDLSTDSGHSSAHGLNGPRRRHKPTAEEKCGSFGCVLPKGHNMGRADIPENHAVPVSAGDEWCPGHGSFSEHRRTLKSDCTLCRGEYMPEQTVSAGVGQVPADTIVRDRLARALMWLDPVALAEDEDVALNQAREAIRAALAAVRTPEEQVQEEDS